MIKRLFKAAAILLAASLLSVAVYSDGLSVEVPSAILIEQTTGKVLYELNADAVLPPASVTKVMTMLLVMEAVDGGICSMGDSVQISEYAASMGGSQVFLAPGEIMTVEELLKSVAVASANDASVALAEFIAGSEEAFVSRMNERAAQLGMVNTVFENTNGLDDSTQNHVTTARDISIMSAELLRHPKILEFTSIWMDSIRGGQFTLTNTNRLIRFYNGANGIKTGSTSRAKFCISAGAKREGMQLIAVIMAAPTRDIRNETAKKLLDYGFANYAFIDIDAGTAEPIAVRGGDGDKCPLEYGEFQLVAEKKSARDISAEIILPDYLDAPIHAGDVVGTVRYTSGGEELGSVNIIASKNVERIGFFGIFGRIIKSFLMA